MSTSLYIHIPFCKSKCFYCSFASFERKDDLLEPYLNALKKEASSYKGTLVSTVYVGGGTPTYLNMEQIGSLFDVIHANFNVAQGAEATFEANPATFDYEKARILRDVGVSRVSLGIQSLNDKYLKYLGRPHNHNEALMAFDILRQANFKDISLDIIYSLPGQTAKEIEEDVTGLVALGSEHVSLYALTVAEGSQFYKRRVETKLQEEQAEDFFLVKGLLEKNGFLHYEISNFTRPGYECRHNVNYWRGGNYIGLGVAAHSHVDGHRFWNVDSLDVYIRKMDSGFSAKAGEEKLRGEKRLMEAFLIGLRMTDGVDVKTLETRLGLTMSPEKQQAVSGLIQNGLLAEEAGRIKATTKGMVVLDEICSRLI